MESFESSKFNWTRIDGALLWRCVTERGNEFQVNEMHPSSKTPRYALFCLKTVEDIDNLHFVAMADFVDVVDKCIIAFEEGKDANSSNKEDIL